MQLTFETKDDFRQWLTEHQNDTEGVWLLFGKAGGPKTLTADEALEEALCFGWIDGQIRSVDHLTYIKYFKKRLRKSNWSARNRKIVHRLIQEGKMSEAGFQAIREAKADGTWMVEHETITDEDVRAFIDMVAPYREAYTNFSKMSPSVQKTYTGFYLSAKHEETREKRFKELLLRFEKNLKPMERE